MQQLRVRARRRLIGAALLVGVGVIGFPLIFETQPRPIPVDLPIDIPRKEATPAVVIPPALPASLPAVAEAPLAQAPLAQAPTEAPAVVTEPKPEPVERGIEKPADKPKPLEKPVDKKPVELAQPKTQESARVQALLEGKPVEKKADSKSEGRFIVQVGAYADGKAAQEARMKVERMGLKTYTQAVDTADGKRIRVRVGPFGSREEADKVAAKVRGGGLSTAVLTL
ncbi:SPOR domain-containing protein [Paucibacter sp. XJ19-41]|nr:SPOR domain-containing protein [Paucibacter sp. XJ19-41]